MLSEKMHNDLDYKTVIKKFLMQEKGNLEIERYPDEENRSGKDIDAVAGVLAIEHTSIDTIIDQRLRTDWFMQVVGGLEEEINPQLGYYLKVILPWDAIATGQDWQRIRHELRSWIINLSPDLGDGVHKIKDIPGIPFEFTVIRDRSFRRRLIFARFSPEDDSLPSRVLSLMKRKIKKLKCYKEAHYITILIVESDDIALMNDLVLLEAIQKGFPDGIDDELDELWYADTSIPEELLFKNFTQEIKFNT